MATTLPFRIVFDSRVMLLCLGCLLPRTAAFGSTCIPVQCVLPVSTPAGAGSSAAVAPSSTCPPQWIRSFGDQPGLNGTIQCLAVFDDGGGPALYAGGSFTTAGARFASNVARWDGASWAPLGDGLDGVVNALAVYDDGSGPALYAGGAFTASGSTPMRGLARWSGTDWSDLGANLGTGEAIRALTAYDLGGGSALYIGGHFAALGGLALSNLARWDGSGFAAVGGGVTTSGGVQALLGYDDGSGPRLYVAGLFWMAGGMIVNNIARWNGTNWSGLGGGMANPTERVEALAAFDDGSGTQLYAGGNFSLAGTAVVHNLAKWNGTSWSTVGAGLGNSSSHVYALASYDDGSGSALYATGVFPSGPGGLSANIARWDGLILDSVGSGLAGSIGSGGLTLAIYDDGAGADLYVGGSFTSAGPTTGPHLARWDSSGWSVVGKGLNGSVRSASSFDDGSGPGIVVGGDFTFADGVASNHIARWNGSGWSTLGSGTDSSVLVLHVFDDGTGPALFAGGTFNTAGGIAANHVARWDGTGWSMLGAGLNNTVNTLVDFDDGSGPALYAGGTFTGAGGVAANCVARWDGTNWSPLGLGLGPAVAALAVFDDGTGPALYAGGSFTAGSSLRLARWDGTNWSTVGGGTAGPVNALAVYDDGSGGALYVAGGFSSAGGAPFSNIAVWTGSHWKAVGGGVSGPVYRLVTFDDGFGPALFAGGAFSSAGGVPAQGLGRWSADGWAGVGTPGAASTLALATYDDGVTQSLVVGGNFAASEVGDSFVARWGRPASCATPGSVVCVPGTGTVGTCPCSNAPLVAGAGCDNSSGSGGATLLATGAARLSADSLLFTSSGENPSAVSVLLQGSAFAATGTVFGQGVRCVAGSLRRLYLRAAVGGSICVPQPVDAHVSARSAALGDTIAPGTHRYYGVYYRDPLVLGGCPATSTFNITQQLDLAWAP